MIDMAMSQENLKGSVMPPEKSFLIQSHALAECLIKIGRLENTKNPLITENLDQTYGQTGKILRELTLPVFEGYGSLLSVFYTFLLLPLEWKEKKVRDFVHLDYSEPEKVARKFSNIIMYNQDYERSHNIKYEYPMLQHFRNSLAHGRMGLDYGKFIVRDLNPSQKGWVYKADYSFEGIGEVAQSLNIAIMNFINDYIANRTWG
jgi:hypothetical protein